MPDVYITITEAAPTILEGLMTALELRAADPQQRAMLDTYLTDAAIPQGARVLEVGCGTGAVTRVLAAWPGVAAAVGVDPSPVFVAKARALGAGQSTLTFEEADGRALPFASDTFDLVVCHTTLCHVPDPDTILHEAVRVLRPGGCLAVFDGDYATGTLATGAGDPLEAVPRRFGRILSMIRGWCGACRDCSRPPGCSSSASAAMAMWRRQRQGSCWSVGWTWGRTRW